MMPPGGRKGWNSGLLSLQPGGRVGEGGGDPCSGHERAFRRDFGRFLIGPSIPGSQLFGRKERGPVFFNELYMERSTQRLRATIREEKPAPPISEGNCGFYGGPSGKRKFLSISLREGEKSTYKESRGKGPFTGNKKKKVHTWGESLGKERGHKFKEERASRLGKSLRRRRWQGN